MSLRAPSEGALRIAIGAVALAGLCVSGYLTAIRAGGNDPVMGSRRLRG